MSLILTTAIEKGGTGKTTTVVNLAALMAAEGKQVLVVDMDQQANTTYMLTQHKKAENFYKGHGLVNMFMNFDLGGMDLAPYIHPTNVEGVHIIPSTAQTPRAVHQLDLLADEYKMKNYTFLIHCLANINDDYDYIVIDTPPARDNLTMSAGEHYCRRTGGALLQKIQSFRGLHAALERDQTASGKKGG